MKYDWDGSSFDFDFFLRVRVLKVFLEIEVVQETWATKVQEVPVDHKARAFLGQ